MRPPSRQARLPELLAARTFPPTTARRLPITHARPLMHANRCAGACAACRPHVSPTAAQAAPGPRSYSLDLSRTLAGSGSRGRSWNTPTASSFTPDEVRLKTPSVRSPGIPAMRPDASHSQCDRYAHQAAGHAQACMGGFPCAVFTYLSALGLPLPLSHKKTGQLHSAPLARSPPHGSQRQVTMPPGVLCVLLSGSGGWCRSRAWSCTASRPTATSY